MSSKSWDTMEGSELGEDLVDRERMAAAGELLELPVPGAPGRTVKGHPATVRRFVDTIAQQLVARTAWPDDNRQQMTALARLFPCFRNYDRGGTQIPGIDPWQPSELVHWLNAGGGITKTSRNAALFLLSVWNGEDWSDPKACDPHLKIRRRKYEVRRIGRFDIADAWPNWDEHHRGAVLAWLLNPFFP